MKFPYAQVNVSPEHAAPSHVRRRGWRWRRRRPRCARKRLGSDGGGDDGARLSDGHQLRAVGVFDHWAHPSVVDPYPPPPQCRQTLFFTLYTITTAIKVNKTRKWICECVYDELRNVREVTPLLDNDVEKSLPSSHTHQKKERYETHMS